MLQVNFLNSKVYKYECQMNEPCWHLQPIVVRECLMTSTASKLAKLATNERQHYSLALKVERKVKKLPKDKKEKIILKAHYLDEIVQNIRRSSPPFAQV